MCSPKNHGHWSNSNDVVVDVNFYDDTHLILYLVAVAVRCEIGFDLDMPSMIFHGFVLVGSHC